MTTKLRKYSPLFLFFASILLASPAGATTYFLSPGGSDSNSGTSAGAPWASPNHSLNCGDVIQAAAGNYSESNFGSGRWGTVACPGNNNVAWIICAAFDACKITTSSNSSGFQISASYWGVQGWEVTATSGSSSGCFQARPPNGSTNVHHVIFANDIANRCFNGGFAGYNNGAASVDYIAFVGDIAYNATQTTSVCTQGFNIYSPVKSDSAAGTHIYVAGNFAWANFDGNPCAGTAPTDGEGLEFDTFDASQGGPSGPYDQQAVAYNNLFVGNGGRGIQVFNNRAGATHAHIYIYQNTTWGNELDTHQGFGYCAEISAVNSYNTVIYNNIAETVSGATCAGQTPWALSVQNGDATDSMSSNGGFSPSGNNVFYSNNGSFVVGSNLLGTNPGFANPVVPGAPSCGSASSVPNCMAPMIANFAPTNSAMKSLGYQIPSTSAVSDPLFPAWLCTANLPSGLVTMPCGTPAQSSQAPQPPSGVIIQSVH